MIDFVQLLVPIVLAAVAVFIASSISHMVLPHHRSDFGKLPAEDEVMDALQKFPMPPGDYMVPRPNGPNDMKNPAYLEKVAKGPVMIVTIKPNHMTNMGSLLGLWFCYLLVVMGIAAHATSVVVGIGAPDYDVFHTISLIVFAGLGLALAQNSIWYARKWSTTIKSMIDAAVYAVIAGGVFMYFWP